jgi:uncharacterized repeat protein (TIGR03803 family)
MKTHIKLLCLLLALTGQMFTLRMSAQTFTNLYFFTAGFTNKDGAEPSGSLLLSGNTLYGSAGAGGTNGTGSMYAIMTNGVGFTNYHSFSARTANSLGHATNSDGAGPTGGFILSGSLLYGTAFAGGTNGNGTVFAVNTNGTGFTVLHYFSAGKTNAVGLLTNSEGATPYTGLILSGTNLYGTACYGGANGYGTVFALSTNGSVFTTLHTFTALTPVTSNNIDGANPYAGLLLSGSTLYGTTQFGGTNATGTVFAINASGSGFTNLHNFAVAAPNAANHITNSDGANGRARLVLSGSTLFGTATFGGTNSYGTVFALQTNGTGFTIIHQFSNGATNALFMLTNTDGAYPQGGVILSSSNLYGAAEYGGTLGLGTLFSLNTNGGNFAVLQAFPAASFNLSFFAETNSIGGYPQSALMLADGVLYGSAALDAPYGSGSLFSFTLGPVVSTPMIAISHSGTNVLMAWPTNFTGYALYYTTNLAPADWIIVSQTPVIVGAQYVVTNRNSGAHLFYRLSQ